MKENHKVFSYKSRIGITALQAQENIKFDISFNENDLLKIAKTLDLISIKKPSMLGKISTIANNQWELKAILGATVLQKSVLSLLPVTTRIDEKIDRRILKGQDMSIQKSELELNDDDFIEKELDLGAIFFECLALNIPTYPKAKDENFEDKTYAKKGMSILSTEKISPFAVLSKLKEKG